MKKTEYWVGVLLVIVVLFFLGWLLAWLVLGFPANFDPIKGVQGWKIYRVYGRFMPTPEMLKSKVKSWPTVVMEKDVYLDEAIVRYCKNYQRFDFVSLRDLVLIENPWIKQGTHYNIRKGDSVKFPQFD